MIRTVRLYGDLAEKYGPIHVFDIETPAEAGKALAVNFPGFVPDVAHRHFRVVRGDLTKGMEHDESQLRLRMGKETDLHIVPAVAGAGRNGGILKVVLGIALVATSIFTAGVSGLGATAFSIGGMGVSWGNIAMFGASMLLKGIVQLASPQPKSNYKERETAANPSFLFNGPVNTMEQGGPVPLVYGRIRMGGHVISSSLRAEQFT